MKSMFPIVALSLAAATAVTFSGCSTEPSTASEKQTLVTDADHAMALFKKNDPSVGGRINTAYGYAIFPTIGKGGAVVGGAYGRGVVYEQGRMIGYCDMSQASIGLQLGGQSYSELILFENKTALDRFKSSEWAPAAQASAVAAASGTAANARYNDGVIVMVTNAQGLMGEASVGGQKFNYRPM